MKDLKEAYNNKLSEELKKYKIEDGYHYKYYEK